MKTNNRQQLLVYATIALVALFAGDKLIFSPMVNAWKERETRIEGLRKKITQGKQIIQRERDINRRWDDICRNTLSSDPPIAEQQLLRAFDSWSQESRVSVTSITPQWKRDSEEYASLECRVDAFGNINTISRFLYDIEKDALGIKVETVEVSARDAEGQQLTLGLQISGLVLNLPAQ